MRYRITSEEMLILRDGRPFGDEGTFGGNSVKWPLPQTITGMLRTTYGLSMDKDFFKDQKNCEAIFNIQADGILPMLSTQSGSEKQWSALCPIPSDIIFTQTADQIQEKKYNIHILKFTSLAKNTGTDIKNKDWLIPTVDIRDKPAKFVPFFLHWKFYQKYIQGNLKNNATYLFDELGINGPVTDLRYHNSLDSETGITTEGALFANQGLYLKHKNDENPGTLDDLGIEFSITGQINQHLLPDISFAYLGGERKKVKLKKVSQKYPAFPEHFANKQFLKIILLTQGDFGSWCPEWLTPVLERDQIEWVKIPDTEIEVRLRSACIGNWEAVSGWDYAKFGPKATKKLVPAGSIYLLELKESSQSEQVARYFWGKNLNPNQKQEENNGYGQCMVGNAHVDDTIKA